MSPFSLLSFSSYAMLFLTGTASASFMQQVIAEGSSGQPSYFQYLESGAVYKLGGLKHAAPEEPSAYALSAFIPKSLTVQKKPTGCFIKGMITDSGAKEYLEPGCDGFDDAKVNREKNEKTFCTEHLAVKAGWTKSKNCPR